MIIIVFFLILSNLSLVIKLPKHIIYYSLFFQYYPAFIISDLCYKMLEDAHEGNISITDEPKLKEDPALRTPPATGENNMAKAYLDHVNEKLQNKVQALKALQVNNFNVFLEGKDISRVLFNQLWEGFRKISSEQMDFCLRSKGNVSV